MKAITVRRPWSYAITHLGKNVENRPRRWNHRGDIAIHAGGRWDNDGAAQICRLTGRYVLDTPGGVVAVAELLDCHESRVDDAGHVACCTSPWAQPGQWHLILTNVRPLGEPVPCRGALGPWTLPDDVESAVATQLNGDN